MSNNDESMKNLANSNFQDENMIFEKKPENISELNLNGNNLNAENNPNNNIDYALFEKSFMKYHN